MALKYLKFSDARQKIWGKYDVQSKERQILRLVAQAFFRDTPLKVSNLLDMSHIASPATIHKAMKLLISKDLLKVKEDKVDGRIKYLAPTNRAIKLFAEIGKEM